MITTIDLFDGWGQKELPAGLDISIFREYLDSIWQNRPLFLSEEDDEDEIRSTRQRFFIIEGESIFTIRAKNYIGFVQYGSLRINVYPRVFSQQKEPNAAHMLQHVFKWLSYCNRIHFPFTNFNAGAEDCQDWMEAFIFLFASFTTAALNTSPHFAYEEITEEMSFVRGRIAMPQYIKNNLANGNHHLLHCTYEPFVYDNTFNRVVKHTAKLLLRCTEEKRNKELLDNICFTLDEVSDVYCTVSDCDNVKINRLYPETDNITNMCRLFLQFQQTDASTASDNHLCVLLPMEVIFEGYVGGFIQYHFPSLNAIVQASGEYLAINETLKPVFRMKHDILINGKLIIDTKYKFRQSEDDKKGVSQNDLYQMTAYCYKREVLNGMLLYPQLSGSLNFNTTQLQINSISVEIEAIDITETEITKFEKLQVAKFSKLLG